MQTYGVPRWIPAFFGSTLCLFPLQFWTLPPLPRSSLIWHLIWHIHLGVCFVLLFFRFCIRDSTNLKRPAPFFRQEIMAPSSYLFLRRSAFALFVLLRVSSLMSRFSDSRKPSTSPLEIPERSLPRFVHDRKTTSCPPTIE